MLGCCFHYPLLCMHYLPRQVQELYLQEREVARLRAEAGISGDPWTAQAIQVRWHFGYTSSYPRYVGIKVPKQPAHLDLLVGT